MQPLVPSADPMVVEPSVATLAPASVPAGPALVVPTPRPAQERERTSIEPSALCRIAALAVDHVSGVALAGPPEHSVRVDVLPDEDLRVVLVLAGDLGTHLPGAAGRVRAEVVGVVGAMTRLRVTAVDIDFVDLTTP